MHFNALQDCEYWNLHQGEGFCFCFLEVRCFVFAVSTLKALFNILGNASEATINYNRAAEFMRNG